MADLTGGRYPAANPLWSQFGQQNNIAQGDVPMWTNAFPGCALSDTAAALTTKVCTAVAVPVPEGVEIKKISVRTGATEVETVSHAFAALYSGLSGTKAPVLLGQSADVTAQVALKTETVTFELEKGVLITNERAPNGFIYVSIMLVATKVPSLATLAPQAVALTKGTTEPWFTGAPIPCQTHGSALTTTAPATITGGSLQAAAPVVFLT
jgi:hypothetical protein